jgi:hypothetical protein
VGQRVVEDVEHLVDVGLVEVAEEHVGAREVVSAEAIGEEVVGEVVSEAGEGTVVESAAVLEVDADEDIEHEKNAFCFRAFASLFMAVSCILRQIMASDSVLHQEYVTLAPLCFVEWIVSYDHILV